MSKTKARWTVQPVADPIRVRLSRASGWRIPDNTVIVDRRTVWGNPYRVGPFDTSKPFLEFRCSTVEESVVAFRAMITKSDVRLRGIQMALRGKNLACWCHIWKCPQCGRFSDVDIAGTVPWCQNVKHWECPMVRVPCHADVLLELANKKGNS